MVAVQVSSNLPFAIGHWSILHHRIELVLQQSEIMLAKHISPSVVFVAIKIVSLLSCASVASVSDN